MDYERWFHLGTECAKVRNKATNEAAWNVWHALMSSCYQEMREAMGLD